jgi:hypothetical protein
MVVMLIWRSIETWCRSTNSAEHNCQGLGANLTDNSQTRQVLVAQNLLLFSTFGGLAT